MSGSSHTTVLSAQSGKATSGCWTRWTSRCARGLQEVGDERPRQAQQQQQRRDGPDQRVLEHVRREQALLGDAPERRADRDQDEREPRVEAQAPQAADAADAAHRAPCRGRPRSGSPPPPRAAPPRASRGRWRRPADGPGVAGVVRAPAAGDRGERDGERQERGRYDQEQGSSHAPMLAQIRPAGLATRHAGRHPVHVTRLSVANALAARRMAVAAGALVVSLLAHAVAVGDLDLTLATPVVWTGLLAVVAVAGPRRRFRARGPVRVPGGHVLGADRGARRDGRSPRGRSGWPRTTPRASRWDPPPWPPTRPRAWCWRRRSCGWRVSWPARWPSAAGCAAGSPPRRATPAAPGHARSPSPFPGGPSPGPPSAAVRRPFARHDRGRPTGARI